MRKNICLKHVQRGGITFSLALQMVAQGARLVGFDVYGRTYRPGVLEPISENRTCQHQVRLKQSGDYSTLKRVSMAKRMPPNWESLPPPYDLKSICKHTLSALPGFDFIMAMISASDMVWLSLLSRNARRIECTRLGRFVTGQSQNFSVIYLQNSAKATKYMESIIV